MERIYEGYMLKQEFWDFLDEKYAYKNRTLYNFVNLIEDVAIEVLKEKGLIKDADNE